MLVEEVYTKTRQRHFELHGTGPGEGNDMNTLACIRGEDGK
jgi:hypothetical protein